MRIFRRLIRRRDVDREIEKELQFHIDERVDHYLATGLTDSEAYRMARAEFGGVQQVKEQVREVWIRRWLDDVRRDAEFALRMYARTPVFAAAAVLTLALGIGVNTALFSIVRQVLLATLPVSNPRELVEIQCNMRPGATGGGPGCMHSYPAFRLLSERLDGLSDIAAFAPVPNGLIAVFRGTREMITGQLVSGNIFNMLGLPPLHGRLLQAADDARGAETVAVLSHAAWQRSFGGRADVVGQSLTLNQHTATIVGILPPSYRGVTFGESYDVVLPLGKADLFRPGPALRSGSPGNILDSANMGWLTFMGRRVSGLSDEDVARRLEPIFSHSVEAMLAPIPSDVRKRLNLNATAIRVNVRTAALGASSNLRRGLEPTLRVLVVVVSLILLVTLANVAGLFLARTVNRQREFGLRLALGAAPGRILRQVVAETMLLAAIGGALGLLLAQWLGPAAFSLATDETVLRTVDLSPDTSTLAFTALLSTLAGLVVALASAVRSSTSNLQDALRSRRTRDSQRLTKIILTLQIALTLTLVGSAALLVQTLTNFRRIDMGFQRKQLLSITMDAGVAAVGPERVLEYVRRASTSLAALPGVTAVTYSNVPFGNGVPINLMLDVPGLPAANGASSGLISAGPEFVRTLGMTLLTGRDFDIRDREGSTPVAIVNESFATAFFPGASALGRTFSLRGPGNPSIQIVGIVKDARDRGVKRPTQPVMYLPFGSREANRVTFTLRGGLVGSPSAERVRSTLETLEPSIGIAKMHTVTALIDDTLRRERFLAALGTSFGGLALLLLAVGVFGMLNGLVLRGTTEIGVRIALGAPPRAIVWMLASETVTILVGGLVIGLLGCWGAGRLIQSELFGVRPSDPISAVASVGALVVVAALAILIPARRAIRIDPTQALRYDEA